MGESWASSLLKWDSNETETYTLDVTHLRLWIITDEKKKTMARTPIHPGEILGDELEETNLSAKKLADIIEVPPNRLYQLVAGKRNMTADTTLRLSRYFGTSADFWMNLQTAYELDLARHGIGKAIQRIPKRSETSVDTKLQS